MRIALVGKSGSGKSEAAEFLRESEGCEIIKTGRICRQIAILLFGNEDKRSTQLLDDVLTKLDESIFLRASLRTVDLNRPFVIDALRFNSDYEIARNLGCFIVRIVADDQERERRLHLRGQNFNPDQDGIHRSETELDAVVVDASINNDGDRFALHAELRSILQVRS